MIIPLKICLLTIAVCCFLTIAVWLALRYRLVQQGKEVICETSQSSIGHGARFVCTDCGTRSESLRQEMRIQEGTGQVRQEGRQVR